MENERKRKSSEEEDLLFLRNQFLRDEIKSSLNLIIIPLLILSAVAIGFALVWASDILVPFVISVFFTYLLRPIVDFLSRPLMCVLPIRLPRNAPPPLSMEHTAAGNQDHVTQDVEHANLLPGSQGNIPPSARPPRRRSVNFAFFRAGVTSTSLQVPRWLAILMSMLLVMAVMVGLVVLVMDAMQTFEEDSLSHYEERLLDLLNIFSKWLNHSFNVDGTSMLAQIKNEFQLLQITKSLLIILVDAVGYTFIVMLFVLYMLFESQGGVEPNEDQPQGLSLRKQIDNQIQRYLVTKTLISIVVGGLTFLVLGPLLHVRMAHLFGVVTFLMNFIPNVGAVVATLLPLPIIILDENLSAITVLLAFSLPAMIHTVVGNIIEPIFFGQQMELHPIVVLLSLSFWFAIWGVPGAILSVPITAVMRIIVSNIAHPYAVVIRNLLEGKLTALSANGNRNAGGAPPVTNENLL